MTGSERERFDALLERVLASLPPRLHRLQEEVALVVDDRPSRRLALQLVFEEQGESEVDPDLAEEAEDLASELCGLHSGTALVHRSVEHPPEAPPVIRIFREGIVRMAGGWGGPSGDRAVAEEIRITVLHEIGHHYGLDEDDLAELGYE